jgi:hypothetical protein
VSSTYFSRVRRTFLSRYPPDLLLISSRSYAMPTAYCVCHTLYMQHSNHLIQSPSCAFLANWPQVLTPNSRHLLAFGKDQAAWLCPIKFLAQFTLPVFFDMSVPLCAGCVIVGSCYHTSVLVSQVACSYCFTLGRAFKFPTHTHSPCTARPTALKLSCNFLLILFYSVWTLSWLFVRLTNGAL